MKILRTGPLKVNTFIVPLVRNFVFIVDPACCRFSRDEDVLSDYLKKNNLVPVAVILTHGHFDHISGLNSLAASYPELPVAIHKNDSNLIGPSSADEQQKHLYLMGFEVFLPFVTDLPAPSGFLEDKKSLWDALGQAVSKNHSSDEALLAEIKEKLQSWLVLHTPGHTSGSCCLYNEEELTLISGDTVFYRSWGRTDLPGGDELAMQHSLMRIFEEVDDKALVYPGHETNGFKLEENF